jgi:hypothetical protein
MKDGFPFSVFRFLSAASYFFPFLGAVAFSSLHMQPCSPQATHFLGLQRVSTVAPHFSQVNTAICSGLQLLILFVISPGGTRARRPAPPIFFSKLVLFNRKPKTVLPL